MTKNGGLGFTIWGLYNENTHDEKKITLLKDQTDFLHPEWRFQPIIYGYYCV
jgi:hypothetical protein